MFSTRESNLGKSKCVVVTGSKGFVGSAVVNLLKQEGYAIVEIDLIGKNSVDISNFRSLANLEIPLGSSIIHLAGYPDSKSCKKDWPGAIQVNLGGLANLLAMAKNIQASKFIFASSEWVYCGLQGRSDFTEKEPISLDSIPDLYARTKYLGEKLLLETMADFSTLACRFGIVYGERVVPKSALEEIVWNLVHRKTVRVGNAESGRSFIHVKDLATALVSSLSSSAEGVLNLAGSRLITLREIFDTTSDILGDFSTRLEQSGLSPDVRGCNIEQARLKLGWSPRVDLRQGVKQLIDYYAQTS